ncbi:MAG: helix-turn-helix domain-containing protein [Paludibacteraceae bacterium]|nr:helix-turn-helix domain-containing protein [Paludibacteraceae bacterium]
MKENISTLSLLDAPTDIWFVGDDIRITHGIQSNYAFPAEFHFRDFVLVYLKRGTLSGRCNGVDTSFTAPSMISIQPTNILECGRLSPDADGTVISFSPSFTQRLNLMHRYQLSEWLLRQPSLVLDSEMEQQMASYIKELVLLGRNPYNPFMEEALLHTTLSFFYRVGYRYYQSGEMIVGRPQQIADEFLQLVQQNGVKEHRMDFYAEKLGVSRKYLQNVVRNVTGRTAYAWIEETVIEHVKYLLRENKLTLQQIAADANLGAPSYFGAYFKRVTGMTPGQYKKMRKNHHTN